MELCFGQQRVYESLEGSGASKMFGMYVLMYPGSEEAYAFVNDGEKTVFYDALWHGDVLQCILQAEERQIAHLDEALFGDNMLELYALLPELEEKK